MSAIPVGLMALMAFAGHLSLGWMYVLVFAGAIPIGLIRPVIGLVGASTVPMECRHSAIALLSLSYNVSQMVGASVGGLLVHSVGAWLVFGLNAVTFLFGAATLTRVQLAPDAAGPVAAGPAASESRVAPKLRDAATVVREMPFLRVAAVTGAAFFMLVAPVQYLMPAVVGKDAPAILVGVLIGAIGVGSVLANPIIGRQKTGSQQNQRLMQLGLLIATAGLVVLALGAQYGIMVGLLAAMLIGFGREFVYVGGVSTATVGVPFEMRGRSMGVLSVIVNGGCALGAIGLGLLADRLGATLMLLAAAGVVLIVYGYLMSRPPDDPTRQVTVHPAINLQSVTAEAARTP
jgi:predicted MFS family arabinose efflux permease